MKTYQEFRANLTGIVDAFLGDMDAVDKDTSLSPEGKSAAFKAVADKHGMPQPDL